eukprot:m.73278 g.73278  ORF g.73278 m.73278 type:complete len:2574 (-) comp7714_c0_seq2:368-8089(-)
MDPGPSPARSERSLEPSGHHGGPGTPSSRISPRQTRNAHIVAMASAVRPVSHTYSAASDGSEITVLPGTSVPQAVFGEFAAFLRARIDFALSEPNLDTPLAKVFAAHSELDRRLALLSAAAPRTLNALIERLIAWRRSHNVLEPDHGGRVVARRRPESHDHNERMRERHVLLINYAFCKAICKIIENAPPPTDENVRYLVRLAMTCIVSEEAPVHAANAESAAAVADLFSHVIGGLSQQHFQLVTRLFLDEADAKPEPEPRLLCAARHMRIRLYPIEALDRSFSFLNHCAQSMVACKSPDSKQAWIRVLADMLRPVAGAVKSEANVPVVRGFVGVALPHLIDMYKRRRYPLEALPLTVSLLAVATREVFLDLWAPVLSQIVPNLKKLPAVQHVVVECLYRLVWVYVTRIRGDSNQMAEARLRTVFEIVFPSGSRIAPADVPLNFFVQLVAAVAVEYPDFVFAHLINAPLALEGAAKAVASERTVVAIRAFLLIVNRMEKLEPPPTFDVPDSRPLRPDRSSKSDVTFEPLSEETISRLRLERHVREFRVHMTRMLRLLDLQAVRAFLATSDAISGRSAEEIFTPDRRRLFDVLIAFLRAFPRCYPLELSTDEVIDFLCRCTIHIDPDVQYVARSHLSSLAAQYEPLRASILSAYMGFYVKFIADQSSSIINTGLRVLLAVVARWNEAAAAKLPRAGPVEDTGFIPFAKDAVVASDGDQVFAYSLSSEAQSVAHSAMTAETDLTSKSTSTATAASLTPALPVGSEGLPDAADWKTRPTKQQMRRLVTSMEGEAKACVDYMDVSSNSPEPANEKLHNELQAVCLVALCMPAHRSRLLALRILQVHSALMSTLITLHETDYSGGEHVFSLLESEDPALFRPDSRADLSDSARHSRDIDVDDDVLPSDIFANPLPAALRELAATGIDSNLWTEFLASLGAVLLLPSSGMRAVTDRLRVLAVHALLNSPTLLSELVAQRRIVLRTNLKHHEDDFQRFRTILHLACAVMTADFSRANAVSIVAADTRQIDVLSGADLPPKFKATELSARDFVRVLIQLLRSEMVPLWRSVSSAIKGCAGTLCANFVEELWPLMKDAIDLCAETSRKKRRRDALRVTVATIMEALAPHVGEACLSRTPSRVHLDRLVRYMNGTRSFLEIETGSDPSLHDLRLCFSSIVAALSHNIKEPGLYSAVFTDDMRFDLYSLMAKWSPKCAGKVDDKGHGEPELELAAYHAVCALARGPMFNYRAAIEDPGYYCAMLQNGLMSTNQDYTAAAQDGIVLLLRSNPARSDLLEWVLHLCYTNAEIHVRQATFAALVELMTGDDPYPADPIQLLCVALLNFVEGSAEMRQTTVDFLLHLRTRFFSTSLSSIELATWLSGGLTAARDQDLEDLSEYLADRMPDNMKSVFAEITMRFSSCPEIVQRRMLALLLPWLTRASLQTAEPAGSADAISGPHVLNNLFYISYKFYSSFPAEFDNAWVAVARQEENIAVIIEYFVEQSCLRESPEYLRHAVQIVAAIARKHPQLVGVVMATIGRTATWDSESRHISSLVYIAPLESLLPLSNSVSPSIPFSCAALLLAEVLVVCPNFDWLDHYPTLLHCAMLGLDHPTSAAFEGSQQLLSNILRCMVYHMISNNLRCNLGPAYELIATLTGDMPALPWEDACPDLRELKSATELTRLMGRLCSVLTAFGWAHMKQIWAEQALRLAAQCNVHYAARSFQIVRCLQPAFTEAVVTDILSILADAVAHRYTELVIECMQTLTAAANICVAFTTGLVMLQEVNIFVAAVIMLESTLEHEYAMALRLAEKFVIWPMCFEPQLLGAIDNSVGRLAWPPFFPGLHALALRGFATAAIAHGSFLFLSLLTPHLGHRLVDPLGDSLPLHVSALLPFLLDKFGDASSNDTRSCASKLSALFEKIPGQGMLVKHFHLYATCMYPKSADAWIADVGKYFCQAYFAKSGLSIVSLLLAPLRIRDHPVRGQTMKVLSSILKCVKEDNRVSSCADAVVDTVVQLARSHAWDEGEQMITAAIACSPLTADRERDPLLADDVNASCSAIQPFRWSIGPAAMSTTKDLLCGLLRQCGRELHLDDTAVHVQPVAPLPFPIAPIAVTPLKSESPVINTSDDSVVNAYLSDFDFLARVEDDRVADTRSESGMPSSPAAPSLVVRASLSGSVPSLPLAVESPAAAGPRMGRLRHDSDPVPLIQAVFGEPLRRQGLLSASQNSLCSSVESQPSIGPIEPRACICSTYVFYPQDAVEQAWETHVQALFEDTTGAVAVNTFGCFTALFKALLHQQRTLVLAAQAAVGDILDDVASRLHTQVDLLTTDCEFPFVYIDSGAVVCSGILERHKAAALEISDLLDGLVRQRADARVHQAAIEGHESPPASASTPVSRPDSASERPPSRHKLLLCAAVTRMHFQLSSMAAAYAKLLGLVDASRNVPLVRDISAEVATAQAAIRGLLDEDDVDKRIDCTNLSKAHALQYVQRNLGRQQIRQAISLMRAFRRAWPGDVFGNAPADDLDVLVNLFAAHQAGTASTLALAGPDAQDLQRAAMRIGLTVVDALGDLRRRLRAVDGPSAPREPL